MKEDVHFFLPEFYGNFRLILFVQEMMQQNPECFYPNAHIHAAYGCFPGAIWNGGRVVLGSATKREMEYVIRAYNDRGIAVRFTYTNPCLTMDHLLDTYCNLAMELANNGMNEVLVNAPVLESYLRERYPNFRYLSSTTKCLRTKEDITRELNKEDYMLVVLDSAWNNTDALFTFPHREKIELLANHYCMDDCPNREAHYRAVGKCQLEFSEIEWKNCKQINRSFYQMMENRSFLKTEELYGRYVDEGFRNFKLDGRAFQKYKVIESFVYFLALPEFRDEVRYAILRYMDK